MKKTLSIILAILMLAALSCSAFCESANAAEENTTKDYSEELASLRDSLAELNDSLSNSSDVAAKEGYITDKAGLLTDDEKTELETKLETLYMETGYETAILTLDDDSCTESTIADYATTYYNSNFYGNGAVLVMCMYERDWYYQFMGEADYMGSYSDEWITESVVNYLSSGDYSTAFNLFTDITEDIYTGTEEFGESNYRDYEDIYSDYNRDSESSFDWKTGLIVALAAGLFAAFLVTSKFKKELKTVEMKANANDYTVPGSLHISASNDVFLYRNVTRHAKPQNNSKNGGYSGGGHSGGGGSHSGGGKF